MKHDPLTPVGKIPLNELVENAHAFCLAALNKPRDKDKRAQALGAVTLLASRLSDGMDGKRKRE
jgi:hypothetical protein